MKKVCFFCGRLTGVKGKHPQAGIFHSVCDECSDKMGLGERFEKIVAAVYLSPYDNRIQLRAIPKPYWPNGAL